MDTAIQKLDDNTINPKYDHVTVKTKKTFNWSKRCRIWDFCSTNKPFQNKREWESGL